MSKHFTRNKLRNMASYISFVQEEQFLFYVKTKGEILFVNPGERTMGGGGQLILAYNKGGLVVTGHKIKTL